MWVDSHCHLASSGFTETTAQILGDMRSQCVDKALVICTKLEEFDTVHSLAMEHSNLWATVGVHPDEKDCSEPSVEDLLLRAAKPKVIAIGETGLDYYWNKGEHASLQWQRDRFARHIQAAKQCQKPLVIHTRSASEDTLAIMQGEHAEKAGGVLHCFTETWEVARAALDMGFYISFSGILTFKSAADLREVALKIPNERLLVETDAPYLAPVPHRGKPNQPAYVSHVGAFLAALKGLAAQDLAQITSANFHTLFGSCKAD
jgi:TatD DNase family protein